MTPEIGTPCWYELTTAPGGLPAAREFYTRVFGWEIRDSGMEGMRYELASGDGGMVAGLMEAPDPAIPPNWLFYTAVGDCDAVAAQAVAAGGRVLMGPESVPGTGRFAVLADPQGAVFGVLSPEPMEGPAPIPYAPDRPGHGAWHELMSPDTPAAMAFYGALFGWAPGAGIPLDQGGPYQLFEQDGQALGGMMGMMEGAPLPYWQPYFRVAGIDATLAAITEAGGEVIFGPMTVPGGAQIAMARDPAGAVLAVTTGA